ncbi:DeoR/GlpR family transcriptional regulator of sugar metabolism [Paenibacillus rhizosphaerae]|uniref:DeoR/GlpR family transcriptional regulator of sugar metabolism n=1 Tax=Paenibacillus rhizosphaerae TaxID=297318 RepID=A0A839TTW4_9BACL|nr:DeoR/GlpR family DNA-binding transcription regulator [Paenibacillus rhizosphaerae]MBB3129070.1 DeoR/GlpR family transcriptional regulator of sugar metabolism [Paenibacillus rhizosphaerae]
MSLTYEERRETILGQLGMEGKVRVHVLAEMFGVSTETIRRDLDRLEKEGKLRKVYGGAVRVRSGFTEPTFTNRSLMHRGEKQEIGKLAALLIEDGETVLLDNGTTTLEIMRNLMERTHVTVITNSVPILNLALEGFRGKIVFAGGEINPEHQAATGMISHELLDRFKVNKAFISAGGISLTDGITDYHLEEALLSRKMIERTEEAILVADHSKFGVTTFAQIAPLTQISMVVTDAGCSREWIDALKQLDIEIISGEAPL